MEGGRFMDSTEASVKSSEEPQEAEEATSRTLKDELAKKSKEVEDYKMMAMYLRADLDNYKKRTAREREDFIKFANESLIVELLDVYENLERALETARKKDEAMARGLEMIYSGMRTTLEKHGLKPIKSVGEKFDPYLHEAMLQEVDDDKEDGTILEEFQRGYTLNMKVIRYAKVKVSKRGE
jgi:molecular chaperone GrpE